MRSLSYSEDAETMTFGVHRRIIESRAKFEYCRIDSKIKYSVKNALDVLLLNDLTDTIKQHKMGEFYIVSKDSDYDYYIKSMHERKINIYKIDDKTKEQLFRSFFGRNLKNKYGEYKEEIVQAYMESRSRQELNNSLQIFFYNENVCEIMRVMQDYIKDMPGSIK